MRLAPPWNVVRTTRKTATLWVAGATEFLSITPRVMNYKIKTLSIEMPRHRRAAAMSS